MADYHLIVAGGNKTVQYLRTSTGVWTSLPDFSPPSIWTYIRAIDGTIDDLWVGLSGVSGYPRIMHWNGSSWTGYNLTGAGSDSNAVVGAVLWVSATEAYCIANSYEGGPSSHLFRWNGSAWSKLGDMYGYGAHGQIWQDENGRVYAVTDKYSNYGQYYTWKSGVGFAAASDGDTSADAVGIAGYSAAELYMIHKNGHLRVGSWGGSWSQIADEVDDYRTTTPQLRITDSYIWTSRSTTSTYTQRLIRRARPGGGSPVDEDTGGNVSQSALLVVLGDGDYVFVPYATGVRRKIGLGGGWTTINRGFAVTAMTGYNLDTAQPYLINQDPAPSDTQVDPNHDISFDIVDDLSGVNAASVVIKVNGVTAWTGDAQQPGFTVVKSVVTNGFRYQITPDTMLPPGTTTVEVYAEDNA